MRGSGLNSDDESDHGIIQRSLDNLFRRLHEQDYSNVEVSVSFLEIYNEELEDMLNPVGNEFISNNKCISYQIGSC